MRLVGIDLGGTNIKAGAISSEGVILERLSIPTNLEDGAQAVLARMAALARELRPERGVGIGTPGLIDRERGVVLTSPNLRVLENQPMRATIARTLEFPESAVFLENDANAAALGEHWLGAGRKQRDLLLVTLGTGVGGGLVLDGRMYAGPGGMAGEIGHVIIDPDGLDCGCGRRGCLEMLASASAAERRALARNLPAERPGDLELLTARSRRAPGPERQLLFDIGRDLGHGLACAVSLLDLRCFVIGGGFGAACDQLELGIHAGLAQRTYGARLADVRLLPAELGSDAGWIGAAKLTLG